MDLALCTTVKSADLKSKKRYSFEISTPDICYLLYADNEQHKDDWIGRVGKAIVRSSRTYYDKPNITTGAGGANGGGGNGMPGGGGSFPSSPGNGNQQDHDDDDVFVYNSDDDDIYENDDPENPYFND